MSFDYDYQGEVLSTTEVSGTLPAKLGQRSVPVEPDDRYPGSFFRIPGVPSPGKTTWGLSD